MGQLSSMNELFLLLVSTTLISASMDYKSLKLLVITQNSDASRQALRELHDRGIPEMVFLNRFGKDEKSVGVIASPAMEDLLRKRMGKYDGVNVKVTDVNVEDMVKKTLPVSQESLSKREEEDFNYLQYEPLSKINNELKRLAAKFREFASLIKLGKSFEGREMLALKVSGRQSRGTIVFIQCGIHAREWISQATCMFLIKELLAVLKKKNIGKPQSIVHRYDWVVLPVFNVDGYVFSHEKDRFWRKNRSATNHSQCRGVDLNRNWPFHFHILGPHNSDNPCSPHYQGNGPASENEVKNVLRYLKAAQKNVVAFFDLHSYGQYFFYPWAYTSSLEMPDTVDLAKVAAECSKALKSVHGRNYTTGRPSKLLYAAGGSVMDYVYGKLGVKLSFSLELRGDSTMINFLLPPDQIQPTGEEVFAAILKAAENVN